MPDFFVIDESKKIYPVAQKEVDISFLNAFLRMKFNYLFYTKTKISFLVDKENKKGKIIMLQSSSKNTFALLALLKTIETSFLSQCIYDIETTLISRRLKKVAQRYGWAIKKKRLFWGDVYCKKLNNYS